MACQSLSGLSRTCGVAVLGGVEKFYAIAFKDLAPVSTATTEVYAVAVNDVINQIGLATGKTFVEIELIRETSGFLENYTKEGVASYWTQTATLQIADVTIENRNFVKALQNNPVAIIYKSKTGKYYLFGESGTGEMTASEGGTGTAVGDLNGYSITFTSTASQPAYIIDKSIITSLIA